MSIIPLFFLFFIFLSISFLLIHSFPYSLSSLSFSSFPHLLSSLSSSFFPVASFPHLRIALSVPTSSSRRPRTPAIARQLPLPRAPAPPTTALASSSRRRRRPRLALPDTERRPCPPRTRASRCRPLPLPKDKHGKRREESRGANFLTFIRRNSSSQHDLRSFSVKTILFLMFDRAPAKAGARAVAGALPKEDPDIGAPHYSSYAKNNILATVYYTLVFT